MAMNKFNPDTIYLQTLWGHAFCNFPQTENPKLPGKFAVDTVKVNKNGTVEEYAVFTVEEPKDGAFPAQWVGTYRIPLSAITFPLTEA